MVEVDQIDMNVTVNTVVNVYGTHKDLYSIKDGYWPPLYVTIRTVVVLIRIIVMFTIYKESCSPKLNTTVTILQMTNNVGIMINKFKATCRRFTTIKSFRQ